MENWWLYILIGLCCGVFGASFGVGSGIILVPVLAILFSFGQKSAQGMSLAVMVPLALMGAWRYYQNPDIDIRLGVVLFLSIGAVIGAFFGAKIAGFLPAHILRKLFAVFLIIAALKMLFFSPAKKESQLQTSHSNSQKNAVSQIISEKTLEGDGSL
jgi:uncharacterized membrane protein YfcA